MSEHMEARTRFASWRLPMLESSHDRIGQRPRFGMNMKGGKLSDGVISRRCHTIPAIDDQHRRLARICEAR